MGVVDEEYTPPMLARLIHGYIPHVNISLNRVNDSFAPHSPLYLESLGIIGSIFGAWLILTLVLLLIYLLSKFCDRKGQKEKQLTAVKVSLILLSLLCCGAIGFGLYGNDDLHNAMLQALKNGDQIATIIDTVNNQSEILESSLGVGAAAPLSRLADALDAPAANQTALGALLRAQTKLRQNASAAVTAAHNIRRPLIYLNLRQLIQWIRWLETVRWWFGMGAWGSAGAVCICALAAAARRSRAALAALSVTALAALVATGLASAILAPLTLASADVCHHRAGPGNALAEWAQRATPPLHPDLVQYYVRCKVPQDNSVMSELRNGERAVTAVRQAIALLSAAAPQIFNDPGLRPALGALSASVFEAERALQRLKPALDCRDTRAAFTHATQHICHDGLTGLTLMFLSAILAMLLFTALVLLESHAWIYISIKRSVVSIGDERAPFLASGGLVLSNDNHCNNTLARSSNIPPPVAASLPPPNNHLNGKPPSYSAAVALSRMEVDDDMRSVRGAGREVAPGNNVMSSTVGGGGSHTLGRLPSHARLPPHHNGKYATLSKQCKTLESNDFY